MWDSQSHFYTHYNLSNNIIFTGGPLVNMNKELVGVVNWAEGCGLGLPEGFGNLAYFYDWIQKKLQTE